MLQFTAAGITLPGAAATTSAETGSFVDILSVDPSDYPNVLLNVSVDSAAGQDGLLTEEDFQVIENGVKKEIQSFNFGSTKSDVVFVFDDTGSMGDEIDAMKSEVSSLVSEMEAAGIDSRYGLVTFKDDIETDLELTDDASALQSSVDELRARGGGDGPEDNFDAIERALRFDFRADAQKILVDITDQLSHYRGDGSGFTEYTMDEVATDLTDSGVAYVAVSPGFDDANAAKKVLAEEVGGTWIDIRDADFTVLLEEITELVVTAYVVEYITDLVPGGAAPLSVVVDDPDEGTGRIDDEVDVPSDVDGSYLPSLINQKRGKISDIRDTARPTLTTDSSSIIPDSTGSRFEASEFDAEAERFLNSVESNQSSFDDETTGQYQEAVERLINIEEVTDAAAQAPLLDDGDKGSVIDRQAKAALDFAKTLAFEAVARGAGRAASSSAVRGIADDIVRGTLDEVGSMRRGFSSTGYGGGGYGGAGYGSAASDQRKTFDELDPEYRSVVLERQRNADKQFLEEGAEGLVNGSLGVANGMLNAFDDVSEDIEQFLVRFEYEKYLNGHPAGNPTDALNGLAEFDPPTVDLSDVPESVDVPLSDRLSDASGGVEDATNGLISAIDDATDRVEGIEYIEAADIDTDARLDIPDIPDEIEIPFLSDLPEEIDIGEVTGVSEIQELADLAAEATGLTTTALDPTIDQLVERLEENADEGVLSPQSSDNRTTVLDLANAVIEAVIDVSQALFDGLDVLADIVDGIELFTAFLLVVGAVIGLASTGGIASVPAIGVLGTLATIVTAVSLVIDSASYMVGTQSRESLGSVHNAAGGLLTYTDLSALDGGA